MRHVGECTPVAPRRHAAPSSARAGAERAILSVAGMGCQNCANRVRNALLECEGVVDAEVILPACLVEVWYLPERTPRGVQTFVDAVARASQGTHHQYLAAPLRRLFAD